MTSINFRFVTGSILDNVARHFFINKDQTEVYLEAYSGAKSAWSICDGDSGSNTKHCTIIVAAGADGTKPLPFCL
jgi:hypothetical protein